MKLFLKNILVENETFGNLKSKLESLKTSDSLLGLDVRKEMMNLSFEEKLELLSSGLAKWNQLFDHKEIQNIPFEQKMKLLTKNNFNSLFPRKEILSIEQKLSLLDTGFVSTYELFDKESIKSLEDQAEKINSLLTKLKSSWISGK